ncbi:preprotein translocase subunit YajC [Kineothrix sp. MSJ-39]|uniref:preprotein translocase subunit YajC n=1 Tax=Kineothrix sp. MSJ-39 TaxID=2841533 RepID=UPI001C0FA2B6|nr:preprotein translocase subunit YajC [Kineothrix sp. MSJ-39]MBU5428514.1 preprotein translocase subunit YajC [Kineothrix sp. MSJ-39]
MGILLSETAASNSMSGVVLVVYLVFIVGFIYFLMIRPQKKEQKKMNAMLSQLAIGDSILTTSGFYGMVIDINDDQGTVIVEFGNNKNCRIPMNKTAIVQVEKPDAE